MTAWQAVYYPYLEDTTMKATVLVLAIAACYYTAATLEQAPIYNCGDDTSCYQQCIEFGEDDCE